MRKYRMLDKDRGQSIAINMLVAGTTGILLLFKGIFSLINKLNKKNSL